VIATHFQYPVSLAKASGGRLPKPDPAIIEVLDGRRFHGEDDLIVVARDRIGKIFVPGRMA